jgi:acyl-[acyl carrier protein]--UDP-N-acetylglucosamine O-acyltransferase
MIRYFKNINIGKNNYIEKNVIIHKNVTIGNNNKIYNGTIIYPNTIIGDNNIILNNNLLGEYYVDSRDNFTHKKFNGLVIGNNNYFHIDNKICTGYFHTTIIGDYNKLLAENHISHDTHITNHVTLYPRCTTGGITKLLPYSTMGMGSYIQQRAILGQYAMIGMNNVASHNVFPFFQYFNNKYQKLNKYKIPKELNINEQELLEIINILKKDFNKEYILKSTLDKNIQQIILEFMENITIKKI